MIDPFYEWKDSNASSYADDTTPYSCATEIPSFESELQPAATNFSRWFKKKNILKLIQENPMFCIVPRNLRLFQVMEFLLLQVPTKNY